MRCSMRRRALGRADLHHEIDVAPVDAEIERRGRDHRLQHAGDHGALDLAALLDRERAVMQRDGEAVLVVRPEQFWNSISAWLRVLTKSSVVRCSRMIS